LSGVLTGCLPENELIIVLPVRPVKCKRPTARNGLHPMLCGFEVHELRKTCVKA
jgi:hypothetical protein